MLKPYIVTSSDGDDHILIFSSMSIAKTKSFAYKYSLSFYDYFDIRIRKGDEHLFVLGDSKKIKDGITHMIECPVGCKSCGMWGCGITSNYKCGCCDGDIGEHLLKLHRDYKDVNNG